MVDAELSPSSSSQEPQQDPTIPTDSAPKPFLLTRTLSVAEAKQESPALPAGIAVKIFATGIRPSYLVPWQVKGQQECWGTGFAVAGRRIVTNAHVVEDAVVLQVTKQEDARKYRARAACVAHDVDLAVVHVDDDEFWADLPVARLSEDLPTPYSEVKCVGYPMGGSTLCVTKGIVSRIDAHVYVHPACRGIQGTSAYNPGAVIIVQIDAAINGGNSGGPTFDNAGKVVGVASSGYNNAQNIGYIIPSTVLAMFLDEFAATGQWSGVQEAGIQVVPLENDGMRSYLKMEDQHGVLVSKVAPLGMLKGKVMPGDVLTHVDGHQVTDEGAVPMVLAGQKVFVPAEALITTKRKGEETTLRILREGCSQEIQVVLAPIPPLVPRFHGYDSTPEYVIVGGVVFTRGSVPLLNEYHAAKKPPCYITDSAVWGHFDAYKQDPDHEVVVLLTILKHDINVGYKLEEQIGVVDSFNGQAVRSLAALATMVGKAKRDQGEEFLRIRMKRGSADSNEGMAAPPDIVLERARVEEADRAICKTNSIPAAASKAMLPYLLGKAACGADPVAGGVAGAVMVAGG